MIKKLLLSCSFAFIFFTGNAQFSGNALDFDGSNDMVVSNTVPALFSSPATNDFTIEAWVNPRGSLFARIFFAQPSTTNFVSLGTNTGNTIYFYVIVNGTTYSVATTSSITQNQWTHVAARWTSSTNTPVVFFNGVQQPTVNGGSSSTGTSGLMVLGSRPGGAQFFNGALDEVRVWNEARTLCEIQNNMNHSITGAQTNLVVNYVFNEGTAGGNNTGITNLPDLSGNGYNGTLTNFALTGITSNWITSAATVTTSGNPLGGVSVSQSATICSGANYTFPDGSSQTNITSPVSHLSTLQTVSGCDSLITTNVAVNPTYAVSETAMVCPGSSYTFSDATVENNITAQVIHTSSLQAVTGCDSIITTTVDVNPVYALSETATICSGGSYTFPDASTQSNITSQVIYTSALQTIAGCDSMITTTVNVNPVYAISETATICSGGSYTFPDSTTQSNITAQVVHSSMLQTIAGCDSVITTTVNVNAAYSLSETVALCGGGSYMFPDSTTQTIFSGPVVHTSLLQTTAGCDSTITTTVNVNPLYNFTDSVTVCSGSSYTFPDNTTTQNITAPFNHLSLLLSSAGCDSAIFTAVAVATANSSFAQTSGNTLTATVANAVYQWIDCNAGLAIPGATSQTFTFVISGTYALVVTENGCTDTSSCVSVVDGIHEWNNAQLQVSVYPNPAQDIVNVTIDKNTTGTIQLYELSGAIVRTMTFNGQSCMLDMSGLASGLYWISVQTSEGTVMQKVVKE